MTHPQLRRLKIHRYEQFEDVPWIEFSPDQNLILGINGAGKTSLLKLLRAVLSFDYGPLLDKRDFSLELEAQIPVMARRREPFLADVRAKIEHKASAQSVESDADLDEMRRSGEGARLRGEIDIVVDGELQHLKFGGVGEKDHVAATGGLIPVLVDLGDHGFAYVNSSGAMISEDTTQFRKLTAEIEYALGEAGKVEMPLGEDFDLLRQARVFVSLLARLEEDERKEGLCLDRRSQTGWSGVLNPLLADALVVRPRIIREQAKRLECRGLELRVQFRSGVEVVDSELTFGQRRYLAMALALLSSPGRPIFIDEIDNGLHPRLVEAVLGMLPGRQSFLASHNKLVVDYLNYDSADDVRRKIHICRRDGAGKQTVGMLDEATVQDVFEKISVGVMHPSDVLLAEGLW